MPELPREPFHVDLIWLACGTAANCAADPLLRSILRRHPAAVVGGYPSLKPSSLWWPGLDMLVVGRLSAVSIGPSAAQLSGMREAAEEAAACVVGLFPQLCATKKIKAGEDSHPCRAPPTPLPFPAPLPPQPGKERETNHTLGLNAHPGVLGNLPADNSGAAQGQDPQDEGDDQGLPLEGEVLQEEAPPQQPRVLDAGELPPHLPRVNLGKFSWSDEEFIITVYIPVPEARPLTGAE